MVHWGPCDSQHAFLQRLVLLLVVATITSANFCSDRSNLNSCFQTIEPLLENEQLSGLPSSAQELDVMCGAFHSGMECIDNFAKHCMKPNDQAYLQQTVNGAKQTMKHLCDDAQFRKEYLRHSACYKDLSEEWEVCSTQMKEVVKEDRKSTKTLSKDDMMKKLCCAKYEFLVCTGEVSRTKCSPEASLFLGKIAETLAGSMLDGKCKEMKPNPCKLAFALASRTSAASVTIRPSSWIHQLAALVAQVFATHLPLVVLLAGS